MRTTRTSSLPMTDSACRFPPFGTTRATRSVPHYLRRWFDHGVVVGDEERSKMDAKLKGPKKAACDQGPFAFRMLFGGSDPASSKIPFSKILIERYPSRYGFVSATTFPKSFDPRRGSPSFCFD
jgi:hypothetical protein